MAELAHLTKKTIEDEELAACLAAVQMILEAEQCSVEQQTEVPQSGWKTASLLESTGRSGRVTAPLLDASKRNLWKASGLPRLFILLATVSLGGLPALSIPVSAQNMSGQGGNSAQYVPAEADVMPPLAPEFDAKPPAPIQSDRRSSGPPQLSRPPIPQPTVAEGVAPPAPPANDLADVLGPPYSDQSGGYKPQIVRVALSLDTASTQIVVPDGATLKDASTGDVLAQLPPQSTWQVSSRSPNGIPQLAFIGQIKNAGGNPVLLAQRQSGYRNVAFGAPNGPTGTRLQPLPPQAEARFYLPQSQGRGFLLIPPAPDGTVAVGSNLYRGSLLIRPKKGATFSVINLTDLEDYLLSVVPSEMPSGWSLEALKAQAIAARSYAVASIGKHEADGYDLKQTTDDQVYSGVASENPNSSEAVAETRGMVMRCHGQVITAYFHSTSGGYTELAENVWTKPVPYLKAVPDYDDDSPYFSWNKNYSVGNIEQILARNGKNVGALWAIVPVARGVSPRVRVLLATGSAGNAYISGEEARKIFALPSSCFNVCGANDTYVFAGRGFGHGLGMSQWGAKRLAESGYNAGQILSYYYKDIAIERF